MEGSTGGLWALVRAWAFMSVLRLMSRRGVGAWIPAPVAGAARTLQSGCYHAAQSGQQQLWTLG